MRLTQNDEWSKVHFLLQNGDWWEVNWSLDLWVGFKALFCSHSSGTSRGLTGTSDSYDEVDVLYHNTCWDIMLFVPHQRSVMPQDVTLLSRAALLLGQIFNIWALYCGLGYHLHCNIVIHCNIIAEIDLKRKIIFLCEINLVHMFCLYTYHKNWVVSL